MLELLRHMPRMDLQPDMQREGVLDNSDWGPHTESQKWWVKAIPQIELVLLDWASKSWAHKPKAQNEAPDWQFRGSDLPWTKPKGRTSKIRLPDWTLILKYYNDPLVWAPSDWTSSRWKTKEWESVDWFYQTVRRLRNRTESFKVSF